MSEKNTNTSQSEEVDLGNIFLIIGSGIKKLFAFIGLIFKTAYNLLIHLLIHIFKRKWWYLATIVLGIALGFYFEQTKKRVYTANLYVETNFNSAPEVYENVYNLNQLSINNSKVKLLSKKLNISKEEAKSLVGFDIEPMINENETIDIFSDFKKELDSISEENLIYDDYKNNLTKFNYNKHKIEILSTDQFIFKKIAKKIPTVLIENSYLEKVKNSYNESLLEEIETLDVLDSQIDSLVNFYLKIREIEAKKPNSSSSGTNLYMAEANKNNLVINESELILEKSKLKQRKTYLKGKLLEKENVVNIIGQLPDAGYDVKGFLGNKIVTTPIFLFLIMLFIFSLIELFNFIAAKTEIKSS